MNSSHKFSRNFDKTPAKLKHKKTTCIFYEIYYAYWYGCISQFDVSQGHYMRSWYLKSHAIRLFVQCLLQANNKDDINGVHYWPFVRGIHQWHEYLPLKGPVKIPSPVMQRAFPFHDIYIVYIDSVVLVTYISMALVVPFPGPSVTAHTQIHLRQVPRQTIDCGHRADKLRVHWARTWNASSLEFLYIDGARLWYLQCITIEILQSYIIR